MDRIRIINPDNDVGGSYTASLLKDQSGIQIPILIEEHQCLEYLIVLDRLVLEIGEIANDEAIFVITISNNFNLAKNPFHDFDPKSLVADFLFGRKCSR